MQKHGYLIPDRVQKNEKLHHHLTNILFFTLYVVACTSLSEKPIEFLPPPELTPTFTPTLLNLQPKQNPLISQYQLYQ